MCRCVKHCHTDSKLAKLLSLIYHQAFFFFAQNNLSFVALSHVSSSAFQLLVNGRIVLVAIASILVLDKQLNALEWMAIVLLCVGTMQYSLADCKLMLHFTLV